jgi:hypothetical protein
MVINQRKRQTIENKTRDGEVSTKAGPVDGVDMLYIFDVTINAGYKTMILLISFDF